MATTGGEASSVVKLDRLAVPPCCVPMLAADVLLIQSGDDRTAVVGGARPPLRLMLVDLSATLLVDCLVAADMVLVRIYERLGLLQEGLALVV